MIESEPARERDQRHALKRITLVLGALIALLLTVTLRQRDRESEPPKGAESPSPSEVTSNDALLGDEILQDYASPDRSVQEDLQLIQGLIMSVQTLVKNQDPGRMAVNEDVVEVLLGKNPHKKAFLRRDHPALNERGQLIDRWGSPLFFHLEAADRLDVRSAGPDQRLFTEDDCHLHADGAYMPRERLTGPPHP